MKLIKLIIVTVSFFYAVTGIAADAKLKTFILAEIKAGDVATITTATKAKLSKAGFEIVGEYSPYSTATILIVTNKALKGVTGVQGGIMSVSRIDSSLQSVMSTYELIQPLSQSIRDLEAVLQGRLRK